VATTQKKQMKKIYTIIMALVVSANIFAQAPNCLWATSAGGTNTDEGWGTTTDANGNVFVTGYFKSDTINLGTTTLTNSDNTGNTYDVFLAKYDAAGNVLWAKREGGIGGDYGRSVATDAIGNVYVTGYFNSPTIAFGTTTLTNASNYTDIFIAKYDAAGNVLWAKRAGGNASDIGYSVATDTSGNVFVTGSFKSPTITFGATTLTNAENTGNSNDIFIAKYDAAGTVLWAKRAGGTNTDEGWGIATDASGNVYVSGYFKSTTITSGTTTLTNADSSGSADIFIAKYDAAGTTLWAERAGGTDYDWGHSVSTDASGNVYITGEFISATITFGTITLTNATNSNFPDMFIAKYDAAGTMLWAERAGGTDIDYGYSVATDTSGNVYVMGGFNSSTITFGTTTLTNAGNGDIFIAKYDAAGIVLWAKSAGGTIADEGLGIATDASGNVYVTGRFQSSTITFGTTTLINAGSADIFIAKYDGTGTGVVVDEMFGNKEVSVSPNPFTYQTTITFNEEQKNTTLYIRDALGNEIRREIFSGKQYVIEKGNITAGIYFVQTTDGKKNLTNNKIIIQ
jgi:hypothetical protein